MPKAKDVFAWVPQLELHSQVRQEDGALRHLSAAGLLFAYHDRAQLWQVQQEHKWNL